MIFTILKVSNTWNPKIFTLCSHVFPPIVFKFVTLYSALFSPAFVWPLFPCKCIFFSVVLLFFIQIPPPALCSPRFTLFPSSVMSFFFLLNMHWRINSKQVVPCRATASPYLTHKTTSWGELLLATYSSHRSSCPCVINRPENGISKGKERELHTTDELYLLKAFLVSVLSLLLRPILPLAEIKLYLYKPVDLS